MDQQASRVINLTSPEGMQARRALEQAAWQEKQRELRIAFQEGYADGLQVGETEHWMKGAKVAGLCMLLVGMFVGCAGGMFWMAAGLAAR